MINRYAFLYLCLCASVIVVCSSCVQQMSRQPHVRPLQPSAQFADRQSARPTVRGTIASGYTRTNRRLEMNVAVDPSTDSLPFPSTQEIVERGRERFNIYCSVCHGETGDGYGEIVHRGFKNPSSFSEDRLRKAPLGYFYQVITNGYGVMASNAVQIEPKDRWAIAAYIRALQFSRNARIEEMPLEVRSKRESGGAPH